MVFLELALHQWALGKLFEHGLKLLSLPALVREKALLGTGHFPEGEEDIYHLPRDDLYLSGTSEVQLNFLHAGEILKESDLPLLYAGYSSCFRREAGSYGKDVKGLMRAHQFIKVEQYVICKNELQESEKWQKKLLEISEEMLLGLELPYRVVECCTGDMGTGKVRMFDLECWIPSEERYRETHSCSALHDWQAQRTNTRYREKVSSKVLFCHTLNSTGLASPRILVPFLENHQQEDGSLLLPKALRPLLGKKVLCSK